MEKIYKETCFLPNWLLVYITEIVQNFTIKLTKVVNFHSFVQYMSKFSIDGIDSLFRHYITWGIPKVASPTS